jgi:hypothetical protein
MNKKANTQSCAIFQAQLPKLIGSRVNVTDHSHLRSCSNCSLLLADLEAIAEAARQLFPIQDPSDDLWEEIQFAIEKERPSSHTN